MKKFQIAAAVLCLASGIAFQAGAKDQKNKSNEKNSAKTCATLEQANTSELQANVFQNAAGRVSLILIKGDQEPVTVQIKDEAKRVIYKSKIYDDSVRQNFRMDHVDAGQYQLLLTKGDQCFSAFIQVNH